MKQEAMTYRFPHFQRRTLVEDMKFHGGPLPGDEFPNFSVRTIEGNRLRKKDFIGRKPLLITIGSATCPMTKAAAPVLKDLYRRYGDSVEFVTLYVREAHPGEFIGQAQTFEEKVDHARMLRRRDGLPWEVAVDDLEGDLHQELGSHANATYLVDEDGVVVFRELWSNHQRGLKAALQALISGRKAPIGEDSRRLVPFLGGVGTLAETLDAAGYQAKRDARRQTPIMYAMGSLAEVFKPLPPAGRGLAAVATVGVAAFFLARGIARLAGGEESR